MKRALAALMLLPLLAAAGWRGDGSGLHPGATPPTTLQGSPTWSIPLPAWSNAAPVVVGSRVCVTSEPTTIGCYDAATGRALWQKTNDYADTLSAQELSPFYQRLAQYYADEEAFAAARREVSELRRALRAEHAAPDLSARLQAVSARMEQLRASIDSMEGYLTPADKEIIGYTSSTPVTDGTTIYALFGHGVVSAFALDGTRRWSRWIGPAPGRMNGYNFGSSSALVLADGVLIVPFGVLRGLDPATGRDRWTGERWRHFGTPAVASVGGAKYLATPDGKLVRASDGRVEVTGLGEMWYTSPYAVDDRLYYLGGTTSGDMVGHRGIPIKGWRLSGKEPVVATPLWDTMIEGERSLYTPPVLHDGRLYLIDSAAVTRVIDAATGALLETVTDLPERPGTIYAPPAFVGGRVWFLGEQGVVYNLAPGAQPTLLGRVGASRAPLAFEGSAVYVRTLQQLLRYDGG